MRTLQPAIAALRKNLDSSKINSISVLILVLGLLFFGFWLANYAWTIVKTPYPAEYREGAILLFTDSMMRGVNPFALVNHPLMTNNYGFLYNLTVLPFSILFGNTLAIHRLVSILFVLASCTLIVLTLIRMGVAWPFAVSGGGLVLAGLLFHVTPLARPDSLGEFFFLLSVLIPWQRKFDLRSLLLSGAAGILAFLAKPYFLLSVGIVAAYVFVFLSKKRGLFYLLAVGGTLIWILYVISLFFEVYLVDVVLSNMANTSLSDSHMQAQLILFTKAFLPGFLILLVVVIHSIAQPSATPAGPAEKRSWLDFTRFDKPLIQSPINYFVFFLECTVLAVVLLLGKHMGAYMSYFFQLITPGLILVIFQNRDVLYKYAVVTVPLILINFSLLCFWVLYPNKLSISQYIEWSKLYRYLSFSDHILNSPVMVAEMVRFERVPVDSGQTEYFFNTRPYDSSLFAPEYEQIHQQGRQYLETIRIEIQNQSYEYIFLASDKPELSLSRLADRSLVEQFYDRVELIYIDMPQTNQHWDIEVYAPKK